MFLLIPIESQYQIIQLFDREPGASRFHHSLYSQYNVRKAYLNKKGSVAQNGIFSKYVKFNINIMSKIVFCKYDVHQ